LYPRPPRRRAAAPPVVAHLVFPWQCGRQRGHDLAPGAATTGSSRATGGTNNPQRGTQAPDAQKGGGGSFGAR